MHIVSKYYHPKVPVNYNNQYDHQTFRQVMNSIECSNVSRTMTFEKPTSRHGSLHVLPFELDVSLR